MLLAQAQRRLWGGRGHPKATGQCAGGSHHSIHQFGLLGSMDMQMALSGGKAMMILEALAQSQEMALWWPGSSVVHKTMQR